MTTVVRIGKVKFRINPRDHSPPHVHVEGYGETVRINLMTFEQMDDTGFSPAALRMIKDAVRLHRESLINMWEVYHGKEEDV
jgi:hypothetical protein